VILSGFAFRRAGLQGVFRRLRTEDDLQKKLTEKPREKRFQFSLNRNRARAQLEEW